MPGVKRTHIYITFPRPKARRQLSSWLSWFKVFKSRESQVDKEKLKKQRLLSIIKDMSTGIYDPETHKLFEDDKLAPPYTFEFASAYSLAVEYGEPEQIGISGTGNIDSFVKWLEINKYDFKVLNT